MPNDLTRESDRLIRESQALVRDNREGGRHRRARSEPIGRGSAQLRTEHWARKLKRLGLVVGGILAAAIVTGIIIDGIGFIGVMVSAMLIMCAIAVISGQKLRPPKRADLTRIADARHLVARTELWLEHQRPALPPPAADMVGKIGVQLDALGLQLEGIDEQHPTAVEIRRLVGEHLPEMVESYRRNPAHLRSEKRAGSSADEQLTQSLGKISDEIDSVTRQLAEGSLDNLAIKNRYLEYRYGGADEPASENN